MIWRILKDYALVITVLLVAGAVTGCAAIKTQPPKPQVPTAPDCQDSQPIRLMPNHIQWNGPYIERYT